MTADVAGAADAPDPQLLDDAEFEALEELLTSDAVPEDCMDLEMLDGFLAAVLASPTRIPPAQWLPDVWSAHGDDVSFGSGSQMQRAIRLVRRYYNELATTLGDPSGSPSQSHVMLTCCGADRARTLPTATASPSTNRQALPTIGWNCASSSQRRRPSAVETRAKSSPRRPSTSAWSSTRGAATTSRSALTAAWVPGSARAP